MQSATIERNGKIANVSFDPVQRQQQIEVGTHPDKLVVGQMHTEQIHVEEGESLVRLYNGGIRTLDVFDCANNTLTMRCDLDQAVWKVVLMMPTVRWQVTSTKIANPKFSTRAILLNTPYCCEKNLADT